MSWIPFRKLPKKSPVELAIDSEFTNEVEKFNCVEMNTRKLYKDMKRYIEDNNSLVKAEVKLGQDLFVCSSNLGSDKYLVDTAESIQQVLLKQSELQGELDDNLRKVFVDPMKKFTTNFSTVNNAIKRREQSLQDYRKYVTRRDKFMEKETQPQSGKFDANERYLALAKSDFDRRNAKLLDELPKFYECRVNYFQPCFEALIKCQHKYFKDSRDIFEELASKIDCPMEQRNDDEFREETTKKLAEIKSLSIVAEK